MIDKIEAFCLKILRKIKLGKLADLYESHIEGMRYLIFGGLTTVVNIIVAAFTYYIAFATLSENLRVNLSSILAIIICWIFAYLTNKFYVFHSKNDSIKGLLKEIVSFVSCRLITGVLEVVLMNVFVAKLNFNYMATKIFVSIVVILLNFVFSKLIIFKNKNNQEDTQVVESKKKDVISIVFNIILILILISIFTITALIAFNTELNEHPDEYFHYKAVQYYEENFMPPEFNSEEIADSFSVHGESRLTELDCYYFLVGKYTALIEIFCESSVVIARTFNLILLAIILVLCYKLFKNKSYLFVPFLLSTQIWYVFAYVNNDAWVVFLNLIFVYQLFYKKSMFNNLINTENQELLQNKGKTIGTFILLGLLFYAMLIAKINYLIATGIVAIIYLIINNKTIFKKDKLLKIAGILLIGIICFAVRMTIDFSINGLDRICNMEEIRILHADEEHKPPYTDGESNASFKWSERGYVLDDVLKDPLFYQMTLYSFIGVYGFFEFYATTTLYYIVLTFYIIFLLYIIISNIYKKHNKKEYEDTEKGRLIPFLLALCGGLLTLGLSIYRSYTYDWQPQGRYLFGIIILLCGLMYNQKRNKILDIFFFIISIILVIIYFKFGLQVFIAE